MHPSRLEPARVAPAISIAKGVFMFPTVSSGSRTSSGRDIFEKKNTSPIRTINIAGEHRFFNACRKLVFPVIYMTPWAPNTP